jgi:hypothetical protein
MTKPAVIYSVRLEVLDVRRRRALLRYLRTQHIPDLLAQRGFISAELRALDDSTTLLVEYRVRTLKDLKRYFKSAAPALRADFASRFGPETVRLSREIARPLAATFPAPR